MYDPKYKEAYLAHYNHNHDPNTGRFTGSNISLVNRITNKELADGAIIKTHGIRNVSELKMKNTNYGKWLAGKIRTRYGEADLGIELKDYRINNNSRFSKNVASTINHFIKNEKKIDDICKQTIRNDIEDFFNEWVKASSVPKDYNIDSFLNDVRCGWVGVEEESPIISLSYDDWEAYDVFGGHMFNIDYDYKKKKINSVTMDG